MSGRVACRTTTRLVVGPHPRLAEAAFIGVSERDVILEGTISNPRWRMPSTITLLGQQGIRIRHDGQRATPAMSGVNWARIGSRHVAGSQARHGTLLAVYGASTMRTAARSGSAASRAASSSDQARSSSREAQTVGADLGQAQPLDGTTTRCKGMRAFLALAHETLLMGRGQLLKDRGAVRFRGLAAGDIGLDCADADSIVSSLGANRAAGRSADPRSCARSGRRPVHRRSGTAQGSAARGRRASAG